MIKAYNLVHARFSERAVDSPATERPDDDGAGDSRPILDPVPNDLAIGERPLIDLCADVDVVDRCRAGASTSWRRRVRACLQFSQERTGFGYELNVMRCDVHASQNTCPQSLQ
eukprot:m.187415 g.187415  ORF g.187415 m.187415 type:complete len:113 (+) comp14774_c0_seq3:5950-6288(+)